jgi:uncharacterized repeat protein (TIGR03837 family)
MLPSTNVTREGWDIFCTVIDNFGDAGVCWRLARQLADEYGLSVRLWIDDLCALQRLWPDIALDLEVQRVAGVTVCRWRASFAEAFVEIEAADVVIEAFACTLPENYVAAMTRRAQPSLWINLEYLSAESWVEDCHGLASPQGGSALQKYFFFPGFTANTGGLLCERDLLAQRQAFQADTGARDRFLATFGVQAAAGATVISLFAYATAPLAELLDALAAGPAPTLCLVPEGRLLPAVAQYFDDTALAVGAQRTRGALTVAVLPFLRQDDYDRLLWSCDLNCVRGEDSFVRAQWAARPLLWQIYPQQDEAHWAKLEAFLDLYQAALPAAEGAALTAVWHAWNGRGDLRAAWRALQPLLPGLRIAAQHWAEQQGARANLAAALAQFCANHV